ncbi:hypothetical protein [Guptibacillus hwajinpoensis]|uniref:Extracellular protein n=1 Tax=Guptibacillus hwajinpoensis TaxID=208199 RepID=A0A0J6CWB2_9BACL|nr:hypothetical protein [Alkalihalobacillus macyae]KMM37470.1 extracellular protein [Alkalihalobacillus macyae]MDP4550514.1 hypothetical protein [Alkalihalobacillus macyae]
MIKRIFSIAFIVVLISTLSVPDLAQAYSYGDPTEEIVAEAYVEMSAKLNESPPKYEEANEIFASVSDEIKLHMGDDAVQAVQSELDDENKEAVIKNMQEILVLNISRRLEGVEQDFEEYDTTRKLVGKADATYKKLSPVVKQDNQDLDETIKAEFETLLNSLGNPGLFGVGEKESDKEQFIESKKIILDGLKAQFDMKSVEIGHFGESATDEETASNGKTEWTDLGQLSNWLPLVLLIVVIASVVIYTKRRRRS